MADEPAAAKKEVPEGKVENSKTLSELATITVVRIRLKFQTRFDNSSARTAQCGEGHPQPDAVKILIYLVGWGTKVPPYNVFGPCTIGVRQCPNPSCWCSTILQVPAVLPPLPPHTPNTLKEEAKSKKNVGDAK